MPPSRRPLRKSRRMRRVPSEERIDRISNLPETVLSHILAYLPTNNAVATSILSRRWKNVWTSVRNISCDDRLVTRALANAEVAGHGFADFVDAVVRRTSPGKITKFCIHWSRPTNLSRLTSWIISATVRNVREISLGVGWDNRIELPDTLATSTTLEVLTVDSDFAITVPGDGLCFPVLKVLKVCLHNPENSLTEKLFASCPLLEDLTIEACLNSEGDRPNFVISSTTLTKLALRLSLDDEGIFRPFDHTVMIAAPNLHSLHVTADVLGQYTVHDLQSLTSVRLEIMFAEWAQGDPMHAVQLLEGVSATKSLTISDGIISAVNEAYGDFKPAFPEMTYFEMMVGPYGWRILPYIMRSSSQVEMLVLKKECWFEVTEDDFGWLDVGSVPECLRERVKKIVVRGLEGNDDELQILQYLLAYTESLETMVVRCKSCTSNAELKAFNKKLRRLRRAAIDSRIELLIDQDL